MLHPITHDAFLATLYGGVISGVGVGMVFGRGASTGGTTIIARVLQKVSNLSAGIAQLLVDAVVVGLAALVFGRRSRCMAWSASLSAARPSTGRWKDSPASA